jgi:hypothetical protein
MLSQRQRAPPPRRAPARPRRSEPAPENGRLNHPSTPRLHTVDWLSKARPTSIPVPSDLGTGRGGKLTEQVRHRAIRAVCRNQFVSAECCPPITLAARDKDDRARFVSQPVEQLLDLEVTTVAAFLWRSTQAPGPRARRPTTPHSSAPGDVTRSAGSPPHGPASSRSPIWRPRAGSHPAQ